MNWHERKGGFSVFANMNYGSQRLFMNLRNRCENLGLRNGI